VNRTVRSDDLSWRLIRDLTSRGGFDAMWDWLDPDIQHEIAEKWSELIAEAYERGEES
jgi:hypothetical protein